MSLFQFMKIKKVRLQSSPELRKWYNKNSK